MLLLPPLLFYPFMSLCLFKKFLISMFLVGFSEGSEVDVCVQSTILTQKGIFSCLCVCWITMSSAFLVVDGNPKI